MLVLWPLSSAHAQEALTSLLPWASQNAYRVVFKGVDAELRERLEEAGSLAREEETALAPGLPERRARDDLPELLAVLHARGYYAATISVDFHKREGELLDIVYTVEPGARYTVGAKKIVLSPDSPPGLELPDVRMLAPEKGAPAEAAEMLAGARTAREEIAGRNCLLRLEVRPAVVLNPGERTLEVRYKADAGPRARFGALNISGNESVAIEYILRHIPWRKGDCFDASKITQAELALMETQLFASVEVTHAEVPDEQGEAAIFVTLKERYHRTVKAGLSYMTDEGPGASLGWEHRNILGHGESLDVRGVVSSLQYSAEAGFLKPYFLRKDQSLRLSGKIAREDPEPYTATSTSLSGVVERAIGEHLRVGAGGGYRLSRVEDANGTETFGLVSVPVYGAWDSRDDVLNPQSGIQARLDGAPYFDTLGSGSGFVRLLGSGSTYFKLPVVSSGVLALRGTVGSISGASTNSVPADLRFYAGGGSSVRGYAYQELGPREGGELVGGRSLLEFSTELRLKIAEEYGLVFFLDGGNAFDSEYPDFQNRLRFGAGLGLRYYSAFGPLRLDVALPLDRERGESAYQLYVSLGQAF